MNKLTYPCNVCNKRFVNLKSHQRKSHDVFTFTLENDVEGGTYTLYKNDDKFAIFNLSMYEERYAAGDGEDFKFYDCAGDFNYADRYYSLTIYNDNTFEVRYEHQETRVIVIRRRAIVMRPAN